MTHVSSLLKWLGSCDVFCIALRQQLWKDCIEAQFEKQLPHSPSMALFVQFKLCKVPDDGKAQHILEHSGVPDCFVQHLSNVTCSWSEFKIRPFVHLA